MPITKNLIVENTYSDEENIYLEIKNSNIYSEDTINNLVNNELTINKIGDTIIYREENNVKR